MKNLMLASLLTLLTSVTYSQTETLIASDYVETYNWFGAWFTPAPTTGYFNNISVSPTVSAVIYGTGNNTLEQDWYVLPAVTVDPTKEHIFRMRLAAQTLSNPGANTAGLDGGDYITIQLSKDGGAYVSELRVRGFSNAIWDYSSTAVASKISDGNLTIFTPGGGGNRTNLGDGYSYIEVEIPMGPNSIAIDIQSRVNRSGEDWWMDNFELFEITLSGLPVELLNFEGECNMLKWSTATENNNDYFLVESSLDGFFWDEVSIVDGAGTSLTPQTYNLKLNPTDRLKYYRLTQVDFDGASEVFKTISVSCNNPLEIEGVYNMMGQKVAVDLNDNLKSGMYLIKYSNEVVERIYL